MPYAKLKRMVRRNIRRGVRNVRRRYYRKKTGFNVAALARDVATVKSMLNTEKKRKSFSPEGTRTVAQINNTDGIAGNTLSGHDSVELTSVNHMPDQGIGQSDRIGNSIRICSHIIRFQFWQESNTDGPRRVMIYLIRTRGDDDFFVSEFFNSNDFIQNQGDSITTYDNTCRRNQAYYKNFRVLARRSVYLPADNTSAEKVVRNFTMALKFKKGNHIKFKSDADESISNNRMFLLLTCNAGNKGSGTPAISYIPTAAADSGVRWAYTNDYYFYDN